MGLVPRIALKPDEKHTLSELGKAIRLRRQELKLSQEALADAVELGRTHMGEVERGSRNVSFLAVVRIAAALKVEPSELLAAAGL